MMVQRGALLTAMLLLCNAPAFADSPPPIACAKVAGFIGGPIVPTKDVARDIYLAVAKGRGDSIKPGNTVRVEDDGDHWSAFQWSEPAMLSNGRPSITMGGGALTLMIAKCDGSISAYYAR